MMQTTVQTKYEKVVIITTSGRAAERRVGPAETLVAGNLRIVGPSRGTASIARFATIGT